jgi:hypothetical protein
MNRQPLFEQLEKNAWKTRHPQRRWSLVDTGRLRYASFSTESAETPENFVDPAATDKD